jgi:thiamine kinase-like enzyme
VPLVLVHGDCQPGNVLVAEGRDPVIIDWEFAHVGDPREDLGYYSKSPVVPSLYRADPEAFLAQYRELTGLSESQVNIEVIDYFFILGMAHLLSQIIEAAAALTMGKGRGVMASFLINSVSYFYEQYLEICSQ